MWKNIVERERERERERQAKNDNMAHGALHASNLRLQTYAQNM